jgi:hypothetical protein
MKSSTFWDITESQWTFRKNVSSASSGVFFMLASCEHSCYEYGGGTYFRNACNIATATQNGIIINN